MLNWIRKLLRLGDKGTPCFVVAMKGERKRMLPGLYTTTLESALNIRYQWLDGSQHEFIAKDDSWLFDYQNVEVFRHNVGDIFANAVKASDIDMTSELYRKIIDVRIGDQLADKLEEYREPGGFPWKMVLIIGGIAIGVLILWKTGLLPNLINSLMNTINPPPIPPVDVSKG